MYKNYIFDFYNTLVDIKTDEEKPMLWKKLADYYSIYGADYHGAQLKKEYQLQCRLSEKRLQEETGYAYPEIELGKVFSELYYLAPKVHRSSVAIGDLYQWEVVTANLFRILSREHLRNFPHTLSTLAKLKNRGCSVFILSNAQEIFTMPEMEQSGVLRYVDGVYISSKYRMRKPQKEFMERLLQKEQLDVNDCVMIGNEYQSDIAAAAECGMASIFLNTDGYSETERNKQREQIRFQQGKELREIISGDIREILEEK